MTPIRFRPLRTQLVRELGVGHDAASGLPGMGGKDQAKWGMEEHLDLLKEQGLPIPKENPDPKIVIQNEESLARAS